MNSFFQRTKLTVILLGVAQTVLGFVCFTNPGGATTTVTMMVGWLLIFVGAGTLCACLMRSGQGVDLFVGGVELALGTLMVIRPAFFVGYLFFLLGVMVIITGINDLAEAGRVGGDGSKVTSGMAIATIAVGLLMLVAPFLLSNIIAIIAGIALLVSGVTEVLAGLRMP